MYCVINVMIFKCDLYLQHLETLCNKQAGRQQNDGGRNHLVKIGYCKENLSCIIHQMRLIQFKEDKT